MGGGVDKAERKEADLNLKNWGRYMRDDWLEHHLLIEPIPTGEGYVAPVVAYDDDNLEPAKIPVDHEQGKIAEHVITSIGCEIDGFDYYRVLIRWYTGLMFVDIQQAERYKRLSKHMHTSYLGAYRMLKEAQARFWDRKKVIDGLLVFYKYRKVV